MISRAGSCVRSPAGSHCTTGSASSKGSGFSSSFRKRMNPLKSSHGRLPGGISRGSSIGRKFLGGWFSVEPKLTFEVSVDQRGCAFRSVSVGSNVVQVRQQFVRNTKSASLRNRSIQRFFVDGIPIFTASASVQKTAGKQVNKRNIAWVSHKSLFDSTPHSQIMEKRLR